MATTGIVASYEYVFSYDYPVKGISRLKSFLGEHLNITDGMAQYYSCDFPAREFRAINLLLCYCNEELWEEFNHDFFYCNIPSNSTFEVEEKIEDLNRIKIVSIQIMNEVINFIKKTYQSKPWLDRKNEELYNVEFDWNKVSWDSLIHELSIFYDQVMDKNAIFYWKV